MVDDDNFLGKSTLNSRGRRISSANLREDSESDFND
jgi:hypothetical protein